MATKKLKEMTTAELQARLKAVSGRAFKATNRTWLVDKITEVEAANTKAGKAKARAIAAEAAPRPRATRRNTSTAATAPTDESSDTTPSAADASPEPDGKARHKWAAMSTEDLRAKYLATVGRATESDDRGYLIWKIREAANGKIRTGPSVRRANGEPTTPVTMRIADATLGPLDEAWKRLGYRSRLQLLAHAITLGLVSLGESAVAGGFLPHGPTMATGGAR
jgi:hypothetical protein